MKKYTFLLMMLFLGNTLFSQEMLPKGLSEEEAKSEATYVLPVPKGITNPPSSPVRTAAEWEEMQGVLISWKSGYESYLREIIRYAREEAKVYIYCADSNTVKNNLTQNGIPTSNIRFIIANLNSVWIRDYGPNNVYTNDVDSLLFVDWVYNRPRPQDDASPQYIANLLNVPLYQCTQPPTDLVATGGNFMSDGFGTGFSSKLILEENATVTQYNQTPKNEQQINTIMQNFMGIHRYIKMDNLPYDGIHHIDMHMKLLNEETLLVGQYPQGVSDGPQIEANLNYVLSNFNSVFGTPYKVVRIPMPPSTSGTWPSQGAYYRTYTNSLILNKTVLVPTYYEQYDTTALRIYREAMPGYRIVGINANSIISQSGAIHCTTHEIAAFNPLLISHQPLPNTDNIWTPYQVNAMIKHKTGIQEARIYYRTDTTQPYVYVPMTLTNTANHTWTGYIPVQSNNTTLYYYIWAKANSGKVQVRPLPAPAAYWKFYVYNPTGVMALNDDNFSIKPYYSENLLNIDLFTTTEMNATIQLYTYLGQPVTTIFSGRLLQGYQEFKVPLSLAKGIYLLSVSTPKGNKTTKVVVY
ncbi:MAG: agmatine deiminase family protein [Bacteroidales bacterium]|nr:agmatine deiminase family protein [Bacteroidales bacterium]